MNINNVGDFYDDHFVFAMGSFRYACFSSTKDVDNKQIWAR